MTTPSWPRRLAELRQCQSAGGRKALGGYSIEGLRLIERALRADAPLEFVVVAERLVRSTNPREAQLLAEVTAKDGLEVVVAPDEALEELLEGRTYGALLGFVREPAAVEVGSVFDTDTGGVMLAAVDAEDPGNVGALVRTAFAGGARAFAAIGTSDPYHPKAVRTSMGSVFRLPILRYECAADFLAKLTEARAVSVGSVSRGGVPLPALTLGSERVAVLLGSEAFGLTPELSEQLDERTSIPMPAEVDSFSINAAAAILLYELVTRR